MRFISFFSRRARGWTALFFLALTLIGALTCADYGLPCDATSERNILRQNLNEYAHRLLGDDSQAARFYDEQKVGRISKSVERDHGQCAYYLAAPLLALQSDAPDTLIHLWYLYTWLWFMLGVLSLYGFCRESGLSRPVSCFGSLLLYLCPRFFAEGHYNSKDTVLLSLVLCTLWLGLRFLKRPGFVRALLFSLAGAMATNIKIAGAFAWGLMGLSAVVLVTARREWSRRMAGVAAVAVGGYVAMYALLTPALWGDPVGYFAYLLQNASSFTRWPGVVLFRGMLFEHEVSPLPRYYLPYLMLTTLPLYVPVLAALGQLSALRRAMRQKGALLRDPVTLSLLAATLAWAAPLGVAMVIRPLVYNGWRHFYFVFAGVAVLGAWGAQAAWTFLKSRRAAGWRAAGAGLLCLCMLLSAVGIARNHPYQYGYYNLLARSGAEESMELDYWQVCALNALKKLLAVPRDESLPLLVGTRDDMGWTGLKRSHPVLSLAQRSALTVKEDPDAPYLFYNTTYALIYGVLPPKGYHVLFTLRSYGNTLCTMYERDPQTD